MLRILLSISLLLSLGWDKSAGATSNPRWTQPAEEQLRMFEVQVGQIVLDDVLLAYEEQGMILLPLAGLSKLLGIAVTTDPAEGTATGFVFDEQRRFALDTTRAETVIAGQRQTFDMQRLRIYPDDLYIDATLLETWWPMRFDIDLFALQLRVLPQQPLPIQQKIARQQRVTALQSQHDDNGMPSLPRHPIPYSMATTPFVDLALRQGIRKDDSGAHHASGYRLHASADLAYLESRLFLSGGNAGLPGSTRFTLGRSDPDASLLGALHATQFTVGHVANPGAPLVKASSRPAPGLLLTNQPLFQPSQHDSHSFRGELPEGWDVELYQNNRLIGYQPSPDNGQYHFDDVPLLYGNNSFRLVFHGPQGQQREQLHRFVLGRQLTRPGEKHYRLLLQDQGEGITDAIFDYRVGLNKHWSGQLILTQATVGKDTQRYHGFGLQGYGNGWFGSLDHSALRQGGQAWRINLRGQIGRYNIGLAQTLFKHDFLSPINPQGPDQLRRSIALQINSSLASPWFRAIPWRLGLSSDQLASGLTRQRIEQRLSLQHGALLSSHTLRLERSNGQADQLEGEALLNVTSRSVDAHLRLNAQWAPQQQLKSTALTFSSKQLAPYWLKASLSRDFISRNNRLKLELSRRSNQANIGLTLELDDNGDRRLMLSWRSSGGLDPRNHRLLQRSHSLAATGTASVRVFLDHNQNGRFDADDQPLSLAGFDTGHHHFDTRTNDQGLAFISGLTPHRPAEIRLDSGSLEDPAWIPATPGLRIVPRPGHTALLDFPVVLSGEVDGTIYLKQGDGRKAVADIELELLDADGQVIQRSKSAFDGFYLISGMAIGDYRLRISPQQLERLKLQPVAAVEVHLDSDNPVANGIDFEIEQVASKQNQPIATTSASPPDETRLRNPRQENCVQTFLQQQLPLPSGDIDLSMLQGADGLRSTLPQQPALRRHRQQRPQQGPETCQNRAILSATAQARYGLPFRHHRHRR